MSCTHRDGADDGCSGARRPLERVTRRPAPNEAGQVPGEEAFRDELAHSQQISEKLLVVQGGVTEVVGRLARAAAPAKPLGEVVRAGIW